MGVSKYIFISIILVCFFSIAPLIYAQESNPSPTSVNYELPYPGILPDNPIYFLKTVRDRLAALFISTPQDKAEFDLQQADKRIQAAYMLVLQDKNKDALAETTISKATNYLEDSINNAEAAKKQGMGIADVAKRLPLADKKYIEVLKSIETKVDVKNRKTIIEEEKRIQELQKKIKQIKQ